MREKARTLFTVPRRALFDLVWLGILALLVCVLAIATGFAERIYLFFVGLGVGKGEVGFILGVVAVALIIFGIRRWLDITRAEREFQRLFENAPVGVFRSTPDGRFLMVNFAMAQMFGYDSPQEFVTAFDDIAQQLYVHPENRAAYLERLARDGIVRDYENQMYRKDGSIIWILGNGRAERDAQGNIVYIEGNVQDITARKETEEAYRRLVEQSLQGVLILQDSCIVFCNRTFAEFVGYSVAELLAMPRAQVAFLVHPDDRAQVRERVAARMAGESVPTQFVFQMVHRDGRTRWVESNSSLIEYHGAPAILLLAMDVTERKLAQDKMQENLQRMQLRGDLNASLARAGNDLTLVLDTFARLVAMSIGQSCTVLLLNSEGTALEPVAYHHANMRVVEMVRGALMSKQIAIQENGYFATLATGRTFLLEHIDAAELKRLSGDLFAPVLNHFQTFSVLLAPLRAQSKTLGIVAVARHLAENAFDAEDERLVQELADRAALAIANAQLVQQLHLELEARRQAEDKYRALAEQIPARTFVASMERGVQTAEMGLQLESESSQERAFAEALSQAAALLNHAFDTEQALDGILDTVANIVPYDAASIFLRHGSKLVMARARGFEKYDLTEWVMQVTFPIEMAKFQRLVTGERPVVIADTRLDPDWVHLPETEWIRSQVTAPIRLGSETIGMLGLDSGTPNFYRIEHGTRLIAFADLAAAALHNANLLSETRQRAEQLSLLYDVGLTLNRVLEARTQLQFLFKIAQRALHSDNLAFFRYEPQAQRVEFEMGVGLTPEMERELYNQNLSAAVGESAVGWIAKHRLPALIPLVNQDPRWQSTNYTFHSAVGVPVEHENELHGVLMAVRSRPESFTVQDERLLILFANQVAAAMELSRLFNAQTQRTHELEILREASLSFAAASHAALPALILEFALRLVSANNAFLYFYRNDELEYAGMLWQKDTEMPPQVFLPRRDGLTHTVARTGKIFVVDRVNDDPLFANWRWGGSIVGLPLKGEGQVRAVLNVAYEQPHSFTSEELRALGLLVDQAAVALENASHRAETEAQLRDAQLLHRAGEALSQALSFQDTLERLADLFMEALDIQVCSISEVDFERDELVLLIDRDPIPETRETPGTVAQLSSNPYIVNLLQEGRTMTFRRDDTQLDASVIENMEIYRWKSLLLVPRRAGQETIGIVELANQRAVVTFSPREIRLAESLAHQAASALQNVRLFQQVQRRAEELTLLNRLARRVNRAINLDEMLETIEKEIANVLPSDASFFALYDAATQRVDFRRVIDFGELRPSFQWELGPSFTREVITTRRALRLDDRLHYPAIENPPQFYGDGSTLSSFLAAPIRSGDRVLGVISLQSIRRAAFTAADEQLLQTIADQVAAPIERIQRAD